MDAKEKFFYHIFKEIDRIDHICENYHSHLKFDVAEENYEHLIPPSHISLSEVERVFEHCCRPTNFKEEIPKLYSLRGKEWMNVSKFDLDCPGNISTKGKVLMPSAFDDSDLKFKQEILFLRMKMFKTPPTSEKESQLEYNKNY